ncbi:transposase, Ptta/En/Spm, partial [Tanacetum coccineum]
MITLDGGGFADMKVSHTITTFFKNMFNGSWTTWKEVNKSERDELWAYFEWENVTDVMVREVWEDTMKNRYPNIMLKARKESIKMARLAGVHFDGYDFSVLKPYNPKWIQSRYWEDMIDQVWNTPEWKTKSKSGRVNRLILKEASNHCAGSITIAQHKRKLEEELKTSLTLTTSEIFELTHTKKGTGNGLHEFMKLKAELV